MATYPYGYSGQRVTMTQLEAKTTWRNCHREFQRRLKALITAGNGRIGVGTAWRSSDVQRSVFLARHYGVSSGGCCKYNGRRYQLRKGMAHAAPPGSSFHESVVFGYAAAVDMIGDLAWAAANCEAYGLEQATWGGESWHFQFTEFPHSVTQWKAAGSPAPTVWKLPGGSTPTPTPPPDGLPPKPPIALEVEHMLIMKYGGTPTSGWGGWYSFDGGASRKAVASMAHAATLVDLGALDAKTRVRVTDREWDGVSHTTSAAVLDQYLTPYG